MNKLEIVIPEICRQQPRFKHGPLINPVVAEVVQTTASAAQSSRISGLAQSVLSLAQTLLSKISRNWLRKPLDQATLKRRVRQLNLLHPVIVSLTAQNILLKRRATTLLEELGSG